MKVSSPRFASMPARPVFLGACVAVSAIGALMGGTINTDPIQRAGIGSEEITRAPIAFDPADTGRDSTTLPDQYAMVTPEGVVPVAALATRGVYAQSRYGYREAAYEPPPLPTYIPPAPFAEDGMPEAQPAAVADNPSESPVEVAVAQAVPAATIGNARVIDVAATLAARQ